MSDSEKEISSHMNQGSGMWDVIGIGALLVLVVSASLAMYYGIYGNPIGTVASYVAYATIIFLIIVAVFGKRLQHRQVLVTAPKMNLTRGTVSTAAGTVQMVSG